MTITPEQRERYARIGEAAMGEWWNQDEERIPWDEAQEMMWMDFSLSAEAVALAAQRDIVLSMIADVEKRAPDGGFYKGILEEEDEELRSFLTAYLPAAPSP